MIKKIILIFFLTFISLINVAALESRIIYKVDNEIITNIDIKNQFRYLLILNNNLKDLNKQQILQISKQSAIREKIKKIEVLKNFKKLKIENKFEIILLKNFYSQFQIKTIEEFKDYLKKSNVKFKEIKEKIIIDALWNELIINKYSSKIDINLEKIKDKINKMDKSISKDYLLSEIIFEVANKDEIKIKYNKIKKSIDKIGFQNSSSIYSISDSAKTGGKIGWVDENSFSETVKKKISSLNKGDISKPIITANGVLILKIDDIKTTVIDINFDKELKRIVDYERNKQLNQYSKIYYNKIKRNIEISE